MSAAWYGDLTVQRKNKLIRFVHTAMKATGKEYLSLKTIYEQSVLRQAQRIVTDPLHVFHTGYDLLPTGRRHRVPAVNLANLKTHFVPHPLRLCHKSVIILLFSFFISLPLFLLERHMCMIWYIVSIMSINLCHNKTVFCKRSIKYPP